MTGLELLKREVAVSLHGVSGRIDYNTSIYNALRDLMSGVNPDLTALQQKIQSLEYHGADQKALKDKLPYIVVAGTCPIGSKAYNTDVTPNGLMCLDIDFCDNTGRSLLDLRDELLQLPYVVGVYKSSSGTGLWLLVAIEDSSKFSDYYDYLIKLFKENFSLKIDSNCRNLGRKRYMAYDPDWVKYTKLTEVTPWKLTFPKKSQDIMCPHPTELSLFKPRHFETDEQRDIEVLRSSIEVCVNGGFYIDKLEAWWYAAGECSLVPGGYDLFRRLSANNPTKSSNDTDKLLKRTYETASTSHKRSTVKDCIGKWVVRAKKYKSI